MSNELGATDFTGPVRDLTLVGHWPLNEGTGTTANDIGANANTGTITVGSGSWSNDSVITRKSFLFANTPSASSIGCGNDAALDSLGKRTLTAWIKPTGWGGNNAGMIVSKNDSGTVKDAFFLDGNNATFRFRRKFTGGYGGWKAPDGALSLGLWQFVAVTYDHSNAANVPVLYLNGVAVAVTQVTAPVGTADSFATEALIIGSAKPAGYSFAGCICDVRMYSRILSADEIQALYVGVSSNPTFQGIVTTNDAVVGGKITTRGGVHVGGTSDPGNDNLLVDGTSTFSGAMFVRQVNDAGPMTATGGTRGELVFNLADNKLYVCTVTHATAATWSAAN